VRSLHARRIVLSALVALIGILAAACGSSGSSGSAKPSASSADKPEKTHVTVALLPTPDAAPLFIAIHKGYFKQVGLTVTPQIVQASAQVTPDLVSGKVDFASLNYVSTFEIEQNTGINFRIIAPGTQASPNVFDLLVPKGSTITSPVQLKGKSIAAPTASGAIGNLLVEAALKNDGIAPGQVKFVPVPFPSMQAALTRGQVDAAAATEPFVTAIKAAIGARVVADLTSGSLNGFAVSGWGTTGQYASKYPKTVAAFQTALAKAQRLAASDRALVEQTLPTYTTIKPKIASTIVLSTYPTTLTAQPLQNVADVMLQFGFLHKKFDVSPMILAPPAS
jgi:NitT/TauT family transport system substrate-binding protein